MHKVSRALALGLVVMAASPPVLTCLSRVPGTWETKNLIGSGCAPDKLGHYPASASPTANETLRLASRGIP